ncbi:unnamed protein product [Moneuplotes crassus]|uniref:Uncharacterized protein n=1 Tax=Euplotes crassus TaxID=5936 RepID=A0AAD1Y560_EUPCR|nr:unnamed protein product [Moneuplotes crassus]
MAKGKNSENKEKEQTKENKKQGSGLDFMGIDYFRTLYLALGFLIVALFATYLAVEDESVQKMLFYQGVLATLLFGVLIWFEGALTQCPEHGNEMKKTSKKKSSGNKKNSGKRKKN